MCRILYDAKTANIGYTTSMAVKEIRVLSRGMRQTDVHTEKERETDDLERLQANSRIVGKV